MIISGKKHGFAYAIEKEKLDNMELVDALSEIDTDGLAMSRVVKLMFTNEQKKAMYDAVRDESGRVPSEKISEIIADVFYTLGDQGKNS